VNPGALPGSPDPRLYRQASAAAVSAATGAAAPSGSSNSALRYTTAVHARPVTERHTASANPGQPAAAALTSSATAAPAQARALAIAVNQAARPSLALIPCPVSGASSAGTDHATASA